MTEITSAQRTALAALMADPDVAAEVLKYAVSVQHGGNVYYVDSGNTSAVDATDAGLTPAYPFATLDYAVGRCTANNGDVIHVMPGHTETLIADSAVDVDVAGVTIIGHGRGSNRPTFTFTTAVTADFKLAAANVSIENLLFVAGIDALTGPIEVSGADCLVKNCEFRDDDTNNYETTDVLTVITGGTRCKIDGFKFNHKGGSGGTQAQSCINIAADVANVEVCNCFIATDGQNGGVEVAAAPMVYIHHNHIHCTHADDECITVAGTTTGFISHNNLRNATDGQVTWITAASDCQLFENYGVNADAEAGGLIGTVST